MPRGQAAPEALRLIGQDALYRRAHDWLREGSGQAVLISGAKGSGKRSFARQVAAAVLCERASPETGEACGHCPSCRYMAAGTHPDFRAFEAEEGRKQIPVQFLRDELIADLPLMPQIARRKIYQVNLDGVSEQGQNLLLKSLEEPPAHVLFLLTSSWPPALLATVRSRLPEWRMAPLSPSDMRSFLRRKGLPLDRAADVTALANGSPGRALEILESVWFETLLERVTELFRDLPHMRLDQLLYPVYRGLEEEKEHWPECLCMVQAFLRDLAVVASQTRRTPCQQLLLYPSCAELYWNLVESLRPNLRHIRNVEGVIARIQAAAALNLNFEISLCSLLLSLYKEFVVCQK